MDVEALKKLLVERIEEARVLMTSYGVGPFLSGRATGQLHLAEEVLKLIHQEKSLTQTTEAGKM